MNEDSPTAAVHVENVTDEPINTAIDASKNRFPYSLVWGPLPLITWFLPFIGHMGICDSFGRVHDFAGPYSIGVDDFMVGNVTKYYQFDVNELAAIAAHSKKRVPELWDTGVRAADGEFKKQMHNICCNNCHHHSARALEIIGFPNLRTQVRAWWLLTTRGSYVSWGRLLQTYLPFLILCGLIFGLAFGLKK